MISQSMYGEEIALSHDMMEAATGKSSAEILALPNRIILNYIQKRHSQQCSIWEDRVLFVLAGNVCPQKFNVQLDDSYKL